VRSKRIENLIHAILGAMRGIVALCSILATACYSTEPRGDAETDTGHDVPADTVPDSLVDVPPDTSACEPAGGGALVQWTLDDLEYDDRTMDIPCIVMGVSSAPPSFTIDLTCGTGAYMEPHHLDLDASPGPWLDFYVDAEVQLEYVSHAWEWPERWFALRWGGGDIILAGVEASDLVPWDHDPTTWYDPLTVQITTGLCAAELNECGRRERLALDVTFMEDRELVFDGHSATLGSLASAHASVDTAWYYEEMWCLDHPSQYVTALFWLPPEG